MFPLYKNSSFNFKQFLLKLWPGSGRSCTVQPPKISSKQPCRFRLLAALSVQVCCRCGSALPLPPPSYALPSSLQLYQLVAPDENSHGYPGPPQASPAVNHTIHHRLPSTSHQAANQIFCNNLSTLLLTNQPYLPCILSPLHYFHPTSSKLHPVSILNSTLPCIHSPLHYHHNILSKLHPDITIIHNIIQTRVYLVIVTCRDRLTKLLWSIFCIY